jgi:hypothetical protein
MRPCVIHAGETNMRATMKLLVCLSVLSATFAFAADKVSVNLPFGFESRGKQFPAGEYDVTLNAGQTFLTMTSRESPEYTFSWEVMPAEAGPMASSLDVAFDQTRGLHELSTIRLGTHKTPVLDAQWRRSAKYQPQSASGQ